MVVEVEFDSEAAAIGFIAPDWFGRDISSRETVQQQESMERASKQAFLK